jgi:16S rRNA processing protein RimM
MSRRYVPLAEVARPHGVLGELRLTVYNADSDLLLHKPPVRLRLSDGSERDARVTSARENNKALLVRLEGVVDRDQAEALRGALVCVARDAFPPLDEGEFYACDVEGAQAKLASGEVVGTVRGLRSYPTCEVLVVERAGGRELEVPLVETFVGSIDVERGEVTLQSLDELP